MATVWIPSVMHGLTGGEKIVTVGGSTLRQVIDNLDKAYPGLEDALLDDGNLKPDIAVAIDGELANLGLLQPVGESSEVQFMPAIAGG